MDAEDRIDSEEGSQSSECQIPVENIYKSSVLFAHGLEKSLIVDDDPINCKVLTFVLENLGLEVDVARNGKEAFLMIENKEYSPVLMDIHMPGMNGLEATKMIRDLEKRLDRKRSLIIAMTSNDDEQTIRDSLGAGMDAFLTKPINEQALIDTIGHCYFTKKWKNGASLEDRLAGQKVTAVDQTLWDRRRALELVGGDVSLFGEIAESFVSRNDFLLENIEVAIEQKDVEDLLESAHAYKGVMGHFASPVLRHLAVALEQLAREGIIDGAGIYLTQLKEKSRLLCNDLQQEPKEERRS